MTCLYYRKDLVYVLSAVKGKSKVNVSVRDNEGLITRKGLKIR